MSSASFASSHVSKVRSLYYRALKLAKSWTPDRGSFREKVNVMNHYQRNGIYSAEYNDKNYDKVLKPS